jgi:CelD/BcsL family acetyltransferase involved in cellulose biosynthesis
MLTIECAAGLESAAADWDELAEASGAGPAHSAAWWRAWFSARGRKPAVVVTLRLAGGRPAAILPLQRRDLGCLRILEPLGEPCIALRPVLVSPGLAGELAHAEIGALLRKAAAVAGGADLVLLPGLPATIGGCAHPFLALGRIAGGGGIAVTRLSTPWPRCDARHRGSRTRRKALRREEALAGEGGPGFHMARTDAARQVLLTELSQIRAFKAAADLARIETAEGAAGLWLATLRSCGRPVAVMAGLTEGQTSQGLLYAADVPRESERAARNALVARTLEAAAGLGITRFLLPPGLATRLDHWSDEWIELKQAALALTPVGRIAAAALDRLPSRRHPTKP